MTGDSSATAIRRTERLWRLAQAFLETGVGTTASLQALLGRLYADDAEGLAHLYRVAELAGRIGDELRLPAAVMNDLERAALLHDIGRLVIPDLAVDIAPRAHEAARRRRIEQVEVVVEVAASIGFLAPAVEIVQRSLDTASVEADGTDGSDGEGDPRRVAARVLHLADTLDALSGICLTLSEAQVARGAVAPSRDADVIDTGEPWLSATLRVN